MNIFLPFSFHKPQIRLAELYRKVLALVPSHFLPIGNAGGLDKRQLIEHAALVVHDVLDKPEVSGRLGSQLLSEVADAMMTEAVKISISRTPFMICRAKLAQAVNDLAQYLVLVMDPPSLPDETGLRCNEISGQLQAQVPDLVRLKNYASIWNVDGDISSYADRELIELVRTRFYVSKAKAEIFMLINAYVEGRPWSRLAWYEPLLFSTCVSKEHHYRCQLGMPSLLDSDPSRAEVIASEHGLFNKLVRNGVEDPYDAWDGIVSHIEFEDEANQMLTYRMYLAQYPI